MAVPIRDTQGNVIGALAGVTDLAKPNFLDKIETARYGKFGSYLLNAPQYNLIVTASDKSRIMQPLPPPGVNKILDRYIDGFEGYGISVNSRGVEELTAAKRIPAAGWFMGIVIPTEEAFSPIHDMLQSLLLATFLVTLTAGALTWWMLRRQLAPMLATTKALATLSATNQPPQLLPVTTQDEIGDLIGGFNRLFETLERKNVALAEIAAKAKRFSDSLDNITSCYVSMKDSSRKYIYANKATLSLFKCSAEELVGSGDEEFFPPDTVARLKTVDERVLESGRSTSEEIDVSPDSQERRVYLEVKSPLIDDGGRIIGLCGISTDITERKQIEDELIQHRNHLKELVSARTSELAQSRDAAEAGNRAKTIFLANMSHELRTPMNGVMGMIDLVLMRATDPKQIDWLKKSKGAAQRMINVINDIIDFSKIEADRLPLEEKNFSLSQMIDDVVAMQDLTAEAKGLTLIREIPATFPDQLSGDAFRLRQILLNFLGNACKFSEQGTITVRVSAVEQDGDSVLARIEVEDQGIGISPEQQAMLFQAFTQADGSLTRKYGGSGLGLIISKRLANLLGGDAGLVSQEGHGSTFWATVRMKLTKASEVGI
jgi:PAS domain S-box-containing protein